MMGTERCAIMAALNIAHELLDLKDQSKDNQNLQGQLRDLHSKIEAAVQEQKQLL